MVISARLVRCHVQHVAVVHLVDVIAGQDQDGFGRFGLDALEILENRVGGALVPVRMHAFHGGNHLDILAQFRGQNVPAVADVAGQFQGFILC